MFQGLAAEPGEPPPMTLVPLISQITTCPAPLRQRMSAKPSPLKSPWLTIAQVMGSTEPGEPTPMTLVPFNRQISVCPVLPLRQRMSLRASLLKSWLAANAVPTKPAAMKLAAQHASVPSSRRNPVLKFGLIVFPAYRDWTDGPNAPADRTSSPLYDSPESVVASET